jgi:type IV secretory pathway VirB6-like protein
MDSDGLLVFRIQPLTKADESSFEPACTASINPICLDSLNRFDRMYGPANSDGKYLVQVEQVVTTSIQSGVVSDIVRKVKQYLFGTDANSTGTVQKLFNQFVEDSRFVTMIEAAILLFMTWTGFSYMVGLAQITQRDGVIRLVTLGIVLALLQPRSWEFFNTYLFSLFIDGGGVLIANFINYGDYDQAGTAKDIADVANDPSLVFSLFDKIFNIFLSAPFWYKILALVFSGWLGIYVFVAIFIAVVIFTIGLIKGFIIYMISMIMMGILLLLAPIFITFLLFKYTRKMFTSWLGQLISVTLQPVVVLASIGIFANLFLAGIYAALGFTACKICFIGFSIPAVLPFYCLIPGFTTLNMVHSPDDAILVSPVTNLAAAFYVFIVAHAMYVFVAHSISLLNTIINQNFFTGVNLAGYSNIADYTTGALSTAAAPVNYALGRSDGVKAARQSIDSALRPLSDKFSLGRDVENNKQTYSKVSEALQEVATRSGIKLKDQDYDKFMKNLGAKDSKSDSAYNQTIKSKVDKVALLENSTLTKDEIVQALLRPPEKDTPLMAGGETMFKRLSAGGASDRFEELLERARSTQKPKPQAASRSLIDDIPGSG